jgi:hypothetical protein
MAVKKQQTGSAAQKGNGAGNGVPIGHFSASRTRWQVIVDNVDKASVYRIFNSAEAANALLVRVDEPPRQVLVAPGNSLDVLAKVIRVRAGAGTDADAETDEGWYALVEH